MALTGQAAVFGIFEDRGKANSAIHELWHAGFSHDHVGLVTREGAVKEANTPTGNLEDNAAEGAVAGAITGSAVGAVAGAVAVGLIPGIGPVVAGGLLAGIVGGAAAGAAIGTYAGPFIALGVSEDQARRYEHELKSGRTIVAVNAEDRYDEAVEILRHHGGKVLDQPRVQTAAQPVSG